MEILLDIVVGVLIVFGIMAIAKIIGVDFDKACKNIWNK